MNNKKMLLLSFVILFAIVLVGCAAGPNTAVDTAGPDSFVAGFWLGLWHGIISPITFIISLFSDGVNFYEVHNNGGWYNFGFVLGAGILFGGGGKAACR